MGTFPGIEAQQTEDLLLEETVARHPENVSRTAKLTNVHNAPLYLGLHETPDIVSSVFRSSMGGNAAQRQESKRLLSRLSRYAIRLLSSP